MTTTDTQTDTLPEATAAAELYVALRARSIAARDASYAVDASKAEARDAVYVECAILAALDAISRLLIVGKVYGESDASSAALGRINS